MELKESETDKGDISVVKTEIQPFDTSTDSSLRNKTLIDSPDKINHDVLSEFSSRSKPVNLITLNRKKWATAINSFDNEFIHVIAPNGFKVFIGDIVIVEFPTNTGDFIIQTVQHKYVIQKTAENTLSPVLSLKYLDPRMDKRYAVPADTDIYYTKIDNDVCRLTDGRHFMVRHTGYRTGDSPSMVVKDTIGLSSGLNAKGIEDVSYMDQEMKALTGKMVKAKMDNISTGGCAITVDDEDLKPRSLLLLSVILDIKGIPYRFNVLELLLFAVVRNVQPSEGCCKYGLKFIKHLDNNSLHNFFEIWSARNNSN